MMKILNYIFLLIMTIKLNRSIYLKYYDYNNDNKHNIMIIIVIIIINKKIIKNLIKFKFKSNK